MHEVAIAYQNCLSISHDFTFKAAPVPDAVTESAKEKMSQLISAYLAPGLREATSLFVISIKAAKFGFMYPCNNFK